MRRLSLLLVACSVHFACDVKKLGIAGATCTAASDCADDLQCMQSVCVDPRAPRVAVSPAPSPAIAPRPPAPISPPPAPAPTPPQPAPAAPAPPPVLADLPPPATPPANDLKSSRIPWLERGDEPKPTPPTTPEKPGDPAFPFADPGSWTAFVASGDPWAASLLKALRGIKIGAYGGQSAPTIYKFRIAVCKDGRLDAFRKQSTGTPSLDDMIDSTVESLKIAAPPPTIRDQLGGSCKKIPHEFTMRITGGKTEIN